jgi:acid phosphatase
MKPTRLPRLAVLAAALVLAACATPGARTDAGAATPAALTAAAEATPPQYASDCPTLPRGTPNDNLNAVLWMQTAAEAEGLALQAYNTAAALLDVAIKDPSWNAMPLDEAAPNAADEPTAIILDVDETVLDNTPYNARRIAGVLPDCFGNGAGWRAWSAESDARAVPGAIALTHAAAARGVRVIYLTNRDVNRDDPAASEFEHTLTNLRNLGFPIDDETQLMMRDRSSDAPAGFGLSDKRARRQAVDATHRVIMLFGDNLGDFISVVDPTDPARRKSKTVAARDELIRPYATWWGTRWFVLPNPVYGSWESALAPDLAPDSPAFRRSKHDRLELRLPPPQP